MIPLETLTFGDAIQIAVPNTIQLMTTYVLMEQDDWFEEEIHFVRKLVRPGMTVVDIGANYGVYTLSMAKCLDGSGKLVAFEPTANVAAALRQSIAANGFNTVELRQCALSNRLGTAVFHTDANAELNSLHASGRTDGDTETVELATLDSAFPAGFPQVDFIKMDAEGEEVAILDGAKAFFSRHSPLILYELMHGSAVNEPLISKLSGLGFKNFKLLPGFNVLVPFEPGQPIDKYQINLFACREDRAAMLAKQGLLLHEMPVCPQAPAAGAFTRLADLNPVLAPWAGLMAKTADRDYARALDLYAWHRLGEGSPAESLGALAAAHQLLARQGTPGLGRMILEARVTLDLGLREQSVNILKQLLNTHDEWEAKVMDEPLLPANRHFEQIDTDGRPAQWLFASLLEQYEISGHMSCYFDNKNTRQIIQDFFQLGFPSPILEHRAGLLQLRDMQTNA